MAKKNRRAAIEAYFEYTTDIDLEQQRLSVFANLLFRNNTREMVSNPEIIIQLYPEKTSELSGKILLPKMVKVFGTYTRGGKQAGWIFKDEDWFRRGKETGTYLIGTIEPLRLAPGVWKELSEIQMNFALSKTSRVHKAEAFIKVNENIYSAMNAVNIHMNS